ncbi:MAG: VOC family protein [Methyloligellaceae bacterium]
MRPALTHCAFHVRDMDTTIAFYERFCRLKVVRDELQNADRRVVWMSEPGREQAFVFVFLSGGQRRRQSPGDMTHYGFAVDHKRDVDRIAELGRAAGCLCREPQELPFPVGYLCALEDPDGYVVEFSYGQPLGAGAEDPA